MLAKGECAQCVDRCGQHVPLMFVIDRPPHLGAELDGKELIPEERMSLMRNTGLEDSKRVFQLPYALAHLGYLAMKLVCVGENESTNPAQTRQEALAIAGTTSPPIEPF